MNGLYLFLTALLVSLPAYAAERTYLEVSPNDAEDLADLFSELETSLNEGLPIAEDPVVIILHGSEARSFTRSGYDLNRDLVNQAARLDAFRLIDVKMCQTWMDENGIEQSEIPAFVETVPFAPEEIERLEAEGYIPRTSIRI